MIPHVWGLYLVLGFSIIRFDTKDNYFFDNFLDNSGPKQLPFYHEELQ